MRRRAKGSNFTGRSIQKPQAFVDVALDLFLFEIGILRAQLALRIEKNLQAASAREQAVTQAINRDHLPTPFRIT